MTDGREAQVGIVLAQDQAIFGAAGKHAIRLEGAARNQIVDQHTDVGLVTARTPGLFTLRLTCGVKTGNQSLRCSLFVTGGAVNLAGKEKSRHVFGFQRRF